MNVTGCPSLEGFADEATVELTAALFTIWATGLEELAARFPFPLYTAVIECVPTDNVFRVRVAVFPTKFTIPNGVDPSWKVTVSVPCTPDAAAIVAVKVTACR